MNRKTKTFLFSYPGVFSAPTAVQYYDLAKIGMPTEAAEPEDEREATTRNTKPNGTRAVFSLPQVVNRLVQKSL